MHTENSSDNQTEILQNGKDEAAAEITHKIHNKTSKSPSQKNASLAKYKPIKKRVNCEQCDKTLSSEAFLRRHKEGHRLDYSRAHETVLEGWVSWVEGNDFTCDICDHRTNTTMGMRSHMRAHILKIRAASKLRSCNLCGEFFTRFTLYKHMKYFHLGMNPSGQCTCDICGKTYNTPDKIRWHMHSAHIRRRKYNCRGRPRHISRAT